MRSIGWRLFPLWMITAMGLVFAVNAYMVYDAYHTFPGVAGTDGFDLSNEYKRILAAAQQQAALGWKIEADLTGGRFPVLRLTDRTGTGLANVTIDAQAERPIGPVNATVLVFHPIGDGRYQTDTSLFSGQWDIMLSVHAGGRQYNTTRRVVVN
jgi:nitrogen fixation protein FixH